MNNKGNSDKQPNVIERFGKIVQVRWNITRNDRTDEDGITRESWDYNYANCNGDSYSEKVQGIIRSRYSQNDVEALLSNYLEGNDNGEYEQFQHFRKLAKAIAKNEDINSLDPANDRLKDLEDTTEAVIETLNQKNIIP